MKYICLSFFLTLNLISFSQSNYAKTIFKELPTNQTSKLNIDLSNYDLNVIGDFKDELLKFEEKVLTVEFNQTTLIMTIIYNDHMLIEDFITCFEKYNIDYTKKVKTDSNLQMN